MSIRNITLIFYLIIILPAFAQSREDSVYNQSVVETLDFLENAYEPQDGWSQADEVAYPSAWITSAPEVLDVVISAYNPACTLLNHRVTSGYGYRPRFGRMHWGVDLSMRIGENVTVPMKGVVRTIGYDKDGYGTYIIVDHSDGWETRYGHLSGVCVKAGDRVEEGQVIAASGNSGNSTAPHLHFELRLNGRPLNPSAYFDFK